MRKSRFLMNLITATAIGLSVMGCDSGSREGAIADGTDRTRQIVEERASLREYMLVAQRGSEPGPSSPLADGQSTPPNLTPGTVVATQPSDGDGTPGGLLFELLGIASQPQPNATPVGPGTNEVGTANDNSAVAAPGTGGYHVLEPSPTGSYAIGIARARNLEPPAVANLQIYSLDIADPLDQVFPPNVVFGPVADNVPIRTFAPNQGEFVSGVWSSDGRHFYAAINQLIITYTIDGNTGRIDEASLVNFPTATGMLVPNNAVKLINSRDGSTVYALDNANSQIIIYARNVATGALTQVTTVATVGDPRGFVIDRSGNFMYVAGRNSQSLAGYKVNADGSLTALDLFPDLGFGAVPFNAGINLGDVANNPQGDTLFVSLYASGFIQTYTIDTTTGALTANGNAVRQLGTSRNAGNIEVEPTGRFVISANEHDLESLVTNGNGLRVFANLDPATNDTMPSSPTPQEDTGEHVQYLVSDTPFTGDVQVLRIQAPGSAAALRAEVAVPVANPYGLAFFQKVLQAPGGDGNEPIVP
jgi:hypothetical protein